MRAKDIMSSPVVTVTEATPVKAAATLLAARGFTALPVVDDDGRLVGIVTEADVVRDRIPPDPRSLVHPGARPARAVPPTVGAVMSAPAVTLGPGADVAALAAALLDAGRRCVPIVDGDKLVGIVTRRDLVRVIARDDETIARDVRHRLETYGGPGRWRVEVRDSVVTIADEFDDATDRHVAHALARAVPGVVEVVAVQVTR
ncbi:CBS domain-containing protein [Actinokineospora sp. HUAS TT18]|uniref:CBS domain-containing protein n=1 Tax=Actinokineospora sp. HUAS TT18 TaxID=3447451 RepID=UPI003F52601A